MKGRYHIALVTGTALIATGFVLAFNHDVGVEARQIFTDWPCERLADWVKLEGQKIFKNMFYDQATAELLQRCK